MTDGLTDAGFRLLLETIATGWNEGDAAKAAACFAEDAVYEEPPAKQLYVGRAELFEFFGGEVGPETPMTMQWHHIVFDSSTQIGAAEYTFAARRRYHGIVLVQVRGGLIARWREYQVASDLAWAEFAGASRFIDEVSPQEFSKRPRSGNEPVS